MTACSSPYVTTGGLARALNSPPLQQRPVINDLRRQRETVGGFNPWSKFCGAIRRDLKFQTGHTRLGVVVREPQRGFADQYRELANGWVRYVQSIGGATGLSLATVRDAVEVRNGLTIKLNPQLGITFPDGRVEVIHLWFDAEPLSPHTAQVLLYLMQANITALFGDATACVVDGRRGQPHRLPTRWRGADIDEYIDTHASRIVSLWGAAAA